MKKHRYFLIAIAALVLGIVVASQFTNRPARPEISATYLPGGKPVTEFSLVDSRGRPFDHDALEGRWSLLFFGYTYCPDVCPMTLNVMANAYRRIEEAGGETPQVVLVSVDPQRDTPERLAEYTGYFHPDFIGATGERDQIDRLTKSLGVAYAIHEDPDGDGQYLVDHSGMVFAINPNGDFQALFSDTFDAEQIAHDYLALRDTWTN